MAYNYVAYDANRKLVRGTIDVATEDLAKRALQISGYNPLSLKPTRQLPSLRRQVPTLFGINVQEVITFSRLMATLVQRGTTAFTALQFLRDQTKNSLFREVIDTVSKDLRQGVSLSKAMSKHPEAFPPIYYRMIDVSERTGNLGVVLRQLADYMEKEKALLARVGKALAYPAFVLVMAGVVITLLTTVTLPGLTELFAELGGQLPLPTQILVALTTFVNAYKLYLFVLIVAGAILAALAWRRPNVRRRLDALLIRMPLIGPIITLTEMTHFSRMLSMCLSASVPMPAIIDMAVKTSRNRVVSEALENVQGEVLKGRGLSQPMSENQVFPPILVQMVKVGEEAGTLDEDLKAVAETYEAEVESKVNIFVSLLGPTLTIILGLIVAFIAVSMIMPIYSIWGQIQ